MPASLHQRRRGVRVQRGVVRDRHGDVAAHRGDVEVAPQLVRAALDREPLARCELGRVGDHPFEIAVAPQQLGGGLLPDAAGARDVVGGVAAQCDQIGHLLGLDAVALAHAGAIDALEHAARTRMQRRRHVRDELVGVAVARDDERTAAARLLLGHRRGEQVVGLVRDDLGGGEAERLGHLGHAVELLAEVVGERIALPLVGRQQLVAVGRHARVEADDHGARAASRATSRAGHSRIRASSPTGLPPAPSTDGIAW